MVHYIRELPAKYLEFQMFVFDELSNSLINKGKDIINLTIGIPELPLSNHITKVLSKAIFDHKKTHEVYPEGIPKLREAIANYYNTQFNSNINYDNIFINIGTSAIFRNLFQLLSHSGLEVLLPRPYYCLYLLSATLTGATIKYYDIDLETGKINFDSFKKALDLNKTSVIVINNPGNPLGNIIPKADIIKINELARGCAYIVHDEIYSNVAFYAKHESPLSYLDEYQDCHIFTNSFSKGFRMYTKRVGYAIVPSKLIMPMRIVQQHTLLTCDPVNQYGAVEALKHLSGPNELMKIYRDRAEYSYETLKGTGCNPIKSYGGFYIILECKEWIEKNNLQSSIHLAKDILESAHVATVPGTDFGIPDGLRLSFCNKRYNEAIDRLEIYFTKCIDKE